MTPKPTPKNGFTKTENLPAYLRQHGLFCLWKYEQNQDRWTKVPHQPAAPQYGAASTNPAHFADLDTAVRASAGFDGIGLGIFGDLAAIDIDHCIDETGNLSQLAQNVIKTMDSYTERSPSGNGVRIVFRVQPGTKYDSDRYYINNQDAREPGENWPTKQGLEIYLPGMTSKYVTVTGDTINADDIKEKSLEIISIVLNYMEKNKKPSQILPAPAQSPVEVSDADLLDAAVRARNGAQFQALFDGDISGYPSHSEADQALFNSLAFWTGKDRERMIRLFSQSGLYRPGKKPKYDSYLARTADKAIRDCTQTYTPPRPRPDPPAPPVGAEQDEPLILDPLQPLDSIGEIDRFLQTVKSRRYEPIPTGIGDIDRIIGGGFIRQTLVTLGASPGLGKTLISQQIFEKIAKDGKANILFFNLEMGTEQLIARSLSRATGIEPLKILQGYGWDSTEENEILAAAEQYREKIAPRIAYNPPPPAGRDNSAQYQTIRMIMDREAEARTNDQLPLIVVIDYLQLLQSEKTGEDDVAIIKAALKSFKDFAIKYSAVVFLIMAHSRATNTAGTVTQGAGRDTSAIEYSGDLQLSLNYTGIVTGKFTDLKEMEKSIKSEKDQDATKDLYNQISLVVTKNRFAPDRGHADFIRVGEQSRFDPVAKNEQPVRQPQRQRI